MQPSIVANVPPSPHSMLLLKTDKARLELSPGVRTLSLRERSLLLLVDGRPAAELEALYHGAGKDIVARLLADGYLAQAGGAAAPAPAATPSAAAVPRQAPSGAPPEAPPAPSNALRSLAGARMYLFDICERMFARRNPALAQNFLDALRGARDRDSMMDVSEALLEEIELLAGPERAATVRRRMEQLLPTPA
ncbi:hypothetical protein QRO11_17485 [Paracidovorax citrulli]|uniref:Uncharacterized protein n=2 Tax=Paracidovorax citrulli TaxID=80869 RepID=A1TLK7_PARC0|nr:hypothetical protein [Paracidovorax citrulli]ABM31845.1 conserved hypothetical protein [Paracidovorax citrulli AAC00-1]ATG95092.1 hypothetical protein CQB05_14560 [Paracidovorax citrulli]MVT38315.1 hypothetical protein [Paracidovorax citrulli]PVY66034.1 hypothetical protein C8E08_3423 [Paracidovorax citrulli]QCX11777.1 hypothetical protein APS58_2984 [Paracidovorax citrulli]